MTPEGYVERRGGVRIEAGRGIGLRGLFGSSRGSSHPEGGEIRAGTDSAGLLRMDIMKNHEILRHCTKEGVSSTSISHGKISGMQTRAKLQNRIDKVVAAAHALDLAAFTILDAILKYGSGKKPLDICNLSPSGELLGNGFQNVNPDPG